MRDIEPRTMAAFVAGIAGFGERPAMIDPSGATVTYEELVAGAERLAGALAAAGVGKGDRFAFLLPNGTRIVECHLACAVSGVTGVPLAARLTVDDLEQQLRDAGATLLLHDAASAETAAALRERIPELHTAVELPDGDAPPDPGITPEDPFCVMFTGGTTGASKAAVLTHEGWACCVLDTVEQLALVSDDRHAVMLPMTHAAWFTLAAHLHVGAVTHVLDRWDPKAYLALVQRDRLTMLHMIPTLLGDVLAAYDGEDVSSARLLTVAGSPMPIEMYRRAREVFGDILANIYGLTEATGPVTYLLAADMDEDRIRSGGRTGRYVEIGILDGEADHAYDGATVGEIALRGPQLTPGYLNQPEENAAAFRDGWFRTGDVGYVDDEGFLFILDRKKDMIKTGGFNVYPKEVEEVLYRHAGVQEAAVIGLPDPKWIEAVAAVVVTADASTTAEELSAFCRQHLAAYKVPKAIHLTDALPRTAFGKFDKKALQRELCAS